MSDFIDRPDVLFMYNNFYPGWKAGGPVQSLNNLAITLSTKMKIAVICSGYEPNETQPLEDIELGKWNDKLGVKVYYLGRNELGYSSVKTLIKNINPRTIYINGLYSLPFVIYPLVAWQLNFRDRSRLILSPRGMLQRGALKVKSLKKNIFLSAFKLFRLQKNITWHATDIQEKEDIRKQFGKTAKTSVISNIPKKPLGDCASISKQPNELRLVYISLITAKKNLHLALQLLKESDISLVFDIYGPIKDKVYWEQCLGSINSMPAHISVRYQGEIRPAEVQNCFLKYHALFLPTGGENFGHAIYECLSVGRPIVISDETPWKNLESNKAGFAIPLTHREKFKDAIMLLYKMDQKEFDLYCRKAYEIACSYWRNVDFEESYIGLFSNTI